eukprot:819996-Amphidinium_carterae.3
MQGYPYPCIIHLSFCTDVPRTFNCFFHEAVALQAHADTASRLCKVKQKHRSAGWRYKAMVRTERTCSKQCKFKKNKVMLTHSQTVAKQANRHAAISNAK